MLLRVLYKKKYINSEVLQQGNMVSTIYLYSIKGEKLYVGRNNCNGPATTMGNLISQFGAFMLYTLYVHIIY